MSEDSFGRAKRTGREVTNPQELTVEKPGIPQARSPQDIIIDLLSNPKGLSKSLGLSSKQSENAQVASIILGVLGTAISGEKTIKLNKALGPILGGAIYGAIGGALGGKLGKDLFDPEKEEDYDIF